MKIIINVSLVFHIYKFRLPLLKNRKNIELNKHTNVININSSNSTQT